MDFSVLMAVYVRENPLFLRQALDSLFGQTRLPFEIVVVKDGPLTEALEFELAEAIQRSPVPLRTVALPYNVGLGEALRAGVEACQGTYIARMDSDDIALPHRFATQFAYLQNAPDLALLGAWIEEFHHTPGDTGRIRRVPTEQAAIRRFARRRNPFNHMSVVFRREAVLAVGNYEPFYLLEDYFLWYRLLRAGYTVANLPECLVLARVGNDMVRRRRGLMYLRSEWRFLAQMWREGFISGLEFGMTAGAKTALRLMPIPLLEHLYAQLRRKTP